VSEHVQIASDRVLDNLQSNARNARLELVLDRGGNLIGADQGKLLVFAKLRRISPRCDRVVVLVPQKLVFELEPLLFQIDHDRHL
jgi:hypothetical protein